MGLWTSILFIEGNHLSRTDQIIEMSDYLNVKLIDESIDFSVAGRDIVELLSTAASSKRFFTIGLCNGWTIIQDFEAIRRWSDDDCMRISSITNAKLLGIDWDSRIGNYRLILSDKGNLTRILEIESGILKTNRDQPLPAEPEDVLTIGEWEMSEMIKETIGFDLEELLSGRTEPDVECVMIKSADNRFMLK